jgi:hypothetical protein
MKGGWDLDRLVETRSPADPAHAYLADLLRTGEPVVVSTARKQQLLSGISSRQQVRHSSLSRLLRPVFVVGVLSLAGAATAAATLGRRVWLERHAPVAEAPAVRVPVAAVRRARPARVALAEPASPASSPEPAAPARPVRRVKPPVRARITIPRAIPGSEDPSQVVDAIQALRNDRDPVRASRLLDGYLTRYPHGALVEEAIALSIEAAAASRSPAAASFAERYLRQYPNGRFRQTAEKALATHPAN